MGKIELKNSHVREAAKALGLSADSLPPIVHVTGTNGKGSTVAFMNSILQASGKKVHAYTSPHLVKVNERIQIANQTISDEQYDYYLNRAELLLPKTLISDFETRTLAAFLAFSEIDADVVLLEVGVGGRLDATNIFDKCLAAVFTPIDLDHQQYLGETISRVAWEKAHIIKPGCRVFSAPQSAEALSVLTEFAERRDAKLTIASRKNFDSSGYAVPNMLGDFQLDNASLAILAMESLYPELALSQINQGLMSVSWAGRLQRTNFSGKQVICDSAHNAHAARNLANELHQLDCVDNSTVMFFALQKNRDVQEFLLPFTGIISTIKPIILPAKYLGDFEILWHDSSSITKIAKNMGFNVLTSDELLPGLEKMEKSSSILLAGSQYMVGDYFEEGLGIKCLTEISSLASFSHQ